MKQFQRYIDMFLLFGLLRRPMMIFAMHETRAQLIPFIISFLSSCCGDHIGACDFDPPPTAKCQGSNWGIHIEWPTTRQKSLNLLRANNAGSTPTRPRPTTESTRTPTRPRPTRHEVRSQHDPDPTPTPPISQPDSTRSRPQHDSDPTPT